MFETKKWSNSFCQITHWQLQFPKAAIWEPIQVSSTRKEVFQIQPSHWMLCNLLNAHGHLILNHAAVPSFHSRPLPPGQCRHARLHVSWGDRPWICPSVTGELLQSYPEGLKLILRPPHSYTGLNLGKWSSWLPLTFLIACFTFNCKLAPLQAWGQGKKDAWGNTVR